jgi:integrase
MTVDQARRKALKLLAEIADGADPSQERYETAQGATVGDLLDRFLAEHASRRKSRTQAGYRWLIEQHLRPVLGTRKVASLGFSDVTRFHRSLADRPYLANRCLSLLATAFQLAERWQWRKPGTNPTRGVERFPEHARSRPLTPEELVKLGAMLRERESTGRTSPVVANVLRLLLLTGMRKSEATDLRWEDVNLDPGELRLRDSKSGPRVVVLGAPAVQLLAGLPKTSSWVFPRKDGTGPLPVPTLDYQWKKLRQAMDFEPDEQGRLPRLHDLRHTAGSAIGSAGFSLPLVAAVLGHRQVRTSERYARISTDPVRAVADDVFGRIGAALDGKPPAEVVPLRR